MKPCAGGRPRVEPLDSLCQVPYAAVSPFNAIILPLDVRTDGSMAGPPGPDAIGAHFVTPAPPRPAPPRRHARTGPAASP
jgi:hypothetical protein